MTTNLLLNYKHICGDEMLVMENGCEAVWRQRSTEDRENKCDSFQGFFFIMLLNLCVKVFTVKNTLCAGGGKKQASSSLCIHKLIRERT